MAEGSAGEILSLTEQQRSFNHNDPLITYRKSGVSAISMQNLALQRLSE